MSRFPRRADAVLFLVLSLASVALSAVALVGSLAEVGHTFAGFVVWDNLALQHGRPALTGGAERTLRRVSAVRANATGQHAWTTVSRAAEASERR